MFTRSTMSSVDNRKLSRSRIVMSTSLTHEYEYLSEFSELILVLEYVACIN